MGSLITDQRDASGQLYRRNRYYDPQSGRFTQEDPIGLAGGINLYGFANGDPVTYSDPYGLAVCARTPGLRRGVSRSVNATITWDENGCVSSLSNVQFHGGRAWAAIQRVFSDMVQSPDVYSVAWRDPSRSTLPGSYFDPTSRTAYIDQGDGAEMVLG